MFAKTVAAYELLLTAVMVLLQAFADACGILGNLAATGKTATDDMPVAAADDAALESAIRRANHAKKLAALSAPPVTPAE